MKIALLTLFSLYVVKWLSNRSKYKKSLQAASEDLHNTIEQVLGSEDLQYLKQRKVWIGMPECLLQYMIGNPGDIFVRETPHTIYKTWLYGPIPNARSNAKRKYKSEFYSENGLVTHWDITK